MDRLFVQQMGDNQQHRDEKQRAGNPHNQQGRCNPAFCRSNNGRHRNRRIISIISAFYQAFRSNKYVSMAMAGMLAGVAAVVFDVVINMAWPILKKKRWLPIAVMLAAFLATRFFSVNIILIILVCGVIGALDTLYLQKREDDK